ncbi:MAG: PKD domain-containing protein, partial [Chloroflexota bacterium]
MGIAQGLARLRAFVVHSGRPPAARRARSATLRRGLAMSAAVMIVMSSMPAPHAIAVSSHTQVVVPEGPATAVALVPMSDVTPPPSDATPPPPDPCLIDDTQPGCGGDPCLIDNTPPECGGGDIPTGNDCTDYGSNCPEPAITADVFEGTAPLDVSFTDTETGYVTTWEWNFGDGATAINRGLIQHAWAAPGTYTVTLTGYNETHPEGVTATLKVEAVDPSYYVDAASRTPVFPFRTWATAGTNI